MAILVFALGLILAIGGGGAISASIDLLPTEMGMLYAIAGVIALCSSAIVISIGALVTRLGASRAPRPAPSRVAEPPAAGDSTPALDAPEPDAPVLDARSPAPEPSEEDGLNENRVGHLPTFAEVESAIAHPEPQPTMVGRYSAGGANYVIFSDGTIEAEIEDGVYRFGSKEELTAYLRGRRV